jgi:hypothetical protein
MSRPDPPFSPTQQAATNCSELSPSHYIIHSSVDITIRVVVVAARRHRIAQRRVRLCVLALVVDRAVPDLVLDAIQDAIRVPSRFRLPRASTT